MSGELWRLSAVELAEGIRQGEYSSRDVVASVSARIADRNPELNAIVYDCRDEALAAAERADATLAEGSEVGPLHGVPVTIKENVDQEGKPTPNGVRAFEQIIAPADAPLVTNLRNAGAIVIGRTNTPELSMRATTDNPLHGRTYNPWDPEASAGGSSGGAGAAAAAGFGPIHHGNDIGGSLRFPSFCNGVTSVKPTFGRIPSYNPSMTGERGMLAQLMSVQGAICREVRDVRLATRVMAHGDPRDPWWVPAPFEGEPAPRRVALTKENYGYPIHPELLSALDRAASHLVDAGYQVEEVTTPSIAEPAQGWFDVAIYEMKETIGPVVEQYGSETLKQIFHWYYDFGDLVDADGYREAIAARTTLTRRWNLFLDEYPLVLSPFLMRPTYPWNYDAVSYEQAHDLFNSGIYSFGINYLGLPAGVVPVGLVEGLPAGVQIVGRRFREDLILDAMEAVEARVGVLAHELWRSEAPAAS